MRNMTRYAGAPGVRDASAANLENCQRANRVMARVKTPTRLDPVCHRKLLLIRCSPYKRNRHRCAA